MIAVNTLDGATLLALEDAALVDTFDPVALAGSDAASGAILAQLAEVSDEVVLSGTPKWKLRSDARQTVLSAIAESNRLDTALDRHTGSEPSFSRYLASALRGVPLEAPPPSPAERETAIVAYEVATASLAGVATRETAFRVAQNDLASLRAQSSLDSERLRSETILAGPLIGRKQERAELVHYIETGTPVADDTLPPPVTPLLALRPFLITGCAGAGKSALLADIIRDYRGPDARGAVVLLDFDRPANCRGGSAEWYSELTRQLGLGNPALTGRMRQLRHRAAASAPEVSMSDSPISGHLFSEEVRNGLVAALAAEEAAGKPLLVVLDTFEEVLTRSDLRLTDGNLFSDVLHWASELAGIRDYANPDAVAFSAVRVIVSSRTRPDLDGALQDWFCGERLIGALDTASARIFLGMRDKAKRLNQAQIERAVEVVGGHPLSLILFERFVCQQPGAIDEVLAQGDLSRMMSGEDAARTLYTRFLRRLTVEARGGKAVDPEKVRRIAHPGLVLREVTAEQIGAIIAPGCGVTLEPGEAEDLFDKLTEQVWLVEEIRGRTPRAVRHRADVRRLMLPMMSGAPEPGSKPLPEGDLGAQVSAVRHLAVAWFQARATQTLDENAVEAAYHRAFLDDIGDADNAALWKLVWNLAPDDVPAMPPRAAALIRYHGRGASSLSREQTEALPEGLRSSVAVEQTSESLSAGRFAEAGTAAELISPISSLEGMSAAPPASDAGASVAPPQSLYALARDPALAAEVNAAFLGGQYHKAAAIGWGAIMGMAKTPLDEPLPIEGDLTSHWIWRAALARMVSPHDIPNDRWLRDLFHDLLTSNDRLREAGLRSAGLVLAAASYIALAGQCEIPNSAARVLAALATQTKFLTGPGDARLLTLAIVGSGQEVSVNVSMARGLLPDTVPDIATAGRLAFAPPRTDRPRPDSRAVRRAPAHGATDPYFLLNAKLPELEPLALAVTGPSIKLDPERLLNAVRRVRPRLPDNLPIELDAEYLRQRMGDSTITDSVLGSVIGVANAHGVLPELLAELDRCGPPSPDLSKMHELVNTYAWLLGAEFDD